ncbi:TetR/AcrR family transcriptional regulator [Streptomyces olivaceus]|nr:TetR/AcrR family transcriptional regulator [Streptomyces olivaceus]MBZ6133333.1 TetR/AcrR family transcriptional regulator [Streptomyces olivaceus]
MMHFPPTPEPAPRHGTSGIEYSESPPGAGPFPDPAAGPVPRVPRDEVRRRLLAAAAQSFAERGYEDSKLEDIAHTAGFTKGAVYSNFAGKAELFGAVLGAGADTEFSLVMDEIRDAEHFAEAVGAASRTVARRIVGDAGRGQLALEFAARAARDEGTREILTPLRRLQRAAASRSIGQVAEHTGAELVAAPDVAALILHCLCNGLSNERIADPEAIDAAAVEQALTTVLTALVVRPAETDTETPRNP